MTDKEMANQICYWKYFDMEDGNDTESIDYCCLINVLSDMVNRIEQLEKDNELLKSYAWEL